MNSDEQTPDHLQPGQVISPRSSEEPQAPTPGAPEPDRAPEPAEDEPAPAPAPPSEPVANVAETTALEPPAAAPEPQTEAGWAYRPDQDAAPASVQPELAGPLTWTAAEFIEHEKGMQWYGFLALGGVVAAALDYWITRDLFSTGVILFAVAAFGAYAARKPREQQYGVDERGVLVGNKVYQHHDFKTFSVVNEGKAVSIVFMPLKRFMPPLTIYVTPEIEATVVNFLSTFLPFEQHRADAVDNFMRRIRF